MTKRWFVAAIGAATLSVGGSQLAGAAAASPELALGTRGVERPAISPKLFTEVATGVARVQARLCRGGVSIGTGFLIGQQVVMTARHVVKDACSTRVVIAGRSYGAGHIKHWYTAGTRDEETADVATLKLSRPAPGHVFSFARQTPKPRTTIAVIGFPLGNPLSLNQGPLVATGRVDGVPVIAVRIATARGTSGSAFLDPAGNVVGILQTGIVSPDDGLVVGVNLVRWWGPGIVRDLCKSYPAGRIPGCGGTVEAPVCASQDRAYLRKLTRPYTRYVDQWNAWVDIGNPPDSSFRPTLDALYNLVFQNLLVPDLPCSGSAKHVWKLIDRSQSILDRIRDMLDQLDLVPPGDEVTRQTLEVSVDASTATLEARLDEIEAELEVLGFFD